jgi:hypothetical protein
LTNAEIPFGFVQGCAEQVSEVLGIKEAYIYRDWQSAIGDLMIVEVSGGSRRFGIMGFGDFEELYLESHGNSSSKRRWVDRLDELFHDVNMTRSGIFDARRQQLRNLQEGCKQLEAYLEEKISKLQNAAAD